MSGQILNDYETLQAGAQTLSQFGASRQQMGRQFKQIHQQLKEHCSGDESGIGAAVQEATSDAAEVDGRCSVRAGAWQRTPGTFRAVTVL